MSEINELTRDAQAAEAIGELDEALAIWRRLVEVDPDIRWQLRLADVLESAEQVAEADEVRAQAVTEALGGRDVMSAIVAACAAKADVGSLFAGRHDLSILGQLSANQFEQIAPALKRRALADGEFLMRVGDPGGTLYVLARGRLEVSKPNPKGEPICVGQLDPGAVVGEMALVLNRPRTASVSAIGACELLEIEIDALKEIAAENAEVSDALSAYTNDRIASAVVATSPLLRGVAPRARRAVMGEFTRIETPAGVALTTQGQAGPGIHVIVSGAVSVQREVDGETVTVATLGPSEVFGEIALLGDGLSTATVTTTEDTVTLALAANEFAALCDDNPAVRAHMGRISAQRAEENRFVFDDAAILEIDDLELEETDEA